MKRKLWLWVAILCMAVLILPCQVMAHSGRTDANGGHKDNQNKSGLGGYHYHCGGHPAHLHPDGVCPYNSTTTSSQTQPKKDTITINNAPAELQVGDFYELEYTITFTDQEQVAIGSNNEDVVKVQDNRLQAVGEGEATITIQTYNNSQSFSIKVKAIPVEAIQASQDTVSLQAGQEFTIGAKAVPDTATYKELAYRSSDESIATVDEEGIITAIAPGEAEIVITAHGNVTLSIPVTVTEVRPEGILTNKDVFQIEITEEDALQVEIVPVNAANKAYEIESLDPSIVLIENGTLKPVKEGETALLITTWNDVVREIPVSIYHIPAESLSIDDHSQQYVFGGHVDVDAVLSLETVLSPDTCTYKEVTWTSGESSVIEIKDTVPVIRGTGKTTLTAHGPDGTSASITITVIDWGLVKGVAVTSIGVVWIILATISILYLKKRRGRRKPS